jgi:tRNA(Ile)-lysidine synthase
VAAARRSLPRPPAVARVLERVTKTARAHDMFRPGETVLLCVSGGPDSVCLLESLVRLRRLFRIRVEVFHLDHRLRPDSADDAAYVRRLAARHAIPFHPRAVAGGPPKGWSIEAWARKERWDAANEIRKATGANVVAEGHTLDDQSETVLLNVIRGTGLTGAGGIAPADGVDSEKRDFVMVQPLIDVERRDVEAFCRALRLRPRRDPMNADTSLLRPAIRHEVIPFIERAVGRDVKRPIARTAENLRADRRALDAQTVRSYRDVVDGGRRTEGIARFDVDALLRLDPVIARRVIRLALYNVVSDSDPWPWTRDAIDAVLDLARGRPGRRRDLPKGSTAVRERRYVHVSFDPPSSGLPPEG